MRSGLAFALLCLVLSACSTGGATRGGLYVYMDEQGNLITGQMPAEQTDAADDELHDNESRADKGQNPVERAPGGVSAAEGSAATSDAEPVLDYTPYTPAPEDAADLPDAEQDRFVTYIDGDGQVTRQRVDMATERQAQAQRDPGYDLIDQAADEDYLETVTPVEAGCCHGLLDDAATLRPGQEVLLRFSAGQPARVLVGGRWQPARVLRLRDDVASLRVLSFKQRGLYLHPQLLMLDEAGLPVLQVNNVFTRRFPESWSRYAYIDGTLPREPGQRYLVVYLGYSEGGLPGLVSEPDSELATEGSVVIRGY